MYTAENIDRRIRDWLSWNTDVARSLHAHIQKHVESFKQNPTQPLSPASARVCYLLGNHGCTQYGLNDDEAQQFKHMARQTGGRSSPSDTLTDAFRRMSWFDMPVAKPANQPIFSPQPGNKVDVLIFRYEAIKNDEGLPTYVLSKETGNIEGFSLDFVEQQKYDNVTRDDLLKLMGRLPHRIKPELARMFDNACHHIETVTLKPGCDYMGYYFLDGYQKFGRKIVTDNDPTGKPTIGRPEIVRS